MGIGDVVGLIIAASISRTWLGTAICGAVIGCLMAIVGYIIAYRNSYTVRAGGISGMVEGIGMNLLIAIPEFAVGGLVLRAIGLGIRKLLT